MAVTAMDTPSSPGLTAEQWAGLARLGDLANGMEQFMGSPASAMPMTMALRAGEWNERYALDQALPEILETVTVLRETGILALVRQNAAFVRESAALITPLIPQLMEGIRQVPWESLAQTMTLMADVLPKFHALMGFLQGPAGSELVAQLKSLGDLWEETHAEESVLGALRLLRQLQEDGNLDRIADLSRQIGLLAETIPVESLIGQMVKTQEANPVFTVLGTVMHSGKAMCEALADAVEHEAKGKAGGIGGLYHMLKDPDVQRGMRVMAAMPVYLQRAGVLPDQHC